MEVECPTTEIPGSTRRRSAVPQISWMIHGLRCDPVPCPVYVTGRSSDGTHTEGRTDLSVVLCEGYNRRRGTLERECVNPGLSLSLKGTQCVTPVGRGSTVGTSRDFCSPDQPVGPPPTHSLVGTLTEGGREGGGHVQRFRKTRRVDGVSLLSRVMSLRSVQNRLQIKTFTTVHK